MLQDTFFLLFMNYDQVRNNNLFPLLQDKSDTEIRLHSRYLVRSQTISSAKAPIPGLLIALSLLALACSWTAVTGDSTQVLLFESTDTGGKEP